GLAPTMQAIAPAARPIATNRLSGLAHFWMAFPCTAPGGSDDYESAHAARERGRRAVHPRRPRRGSRGLTGLAERHQRELFEQNLRSELAGVGSGIVLRCDFHHIGAGNRQATQTTQQREPLA